MKHCRGFALTGLVIIAMMAFSLVSPVSIGGARLVRANLWPEIFEYDDEDFSDEFAPDFESLYSQVNSSAEQLPVETSFFWNADSSSVASGYRIAFLGDSFIEGDILTADLRESLQMEFGGRGVGFVPCELPFGVYRQTAKVHGSGWQKYGVLKYKSVPESLQDSFIASGYMDSGKKGSEMVWERGHAFAHLDSTDVFRVFFRSPGGCSLELSLSDGTARTFEVSASPMLRQIVVGTSSETARMNVISGSLVCYGASFESGGGVHVDNFSVRSNNGNAIFRTNASLNRQFSEMMGYDAVVLQYGLNIMLPDKNNYAKYQKQLEDIIQYAKASFPECDIVVMGVSDRGVKRDGDTTYTSINSAPALTRHQKAAADNQGVLFWNTLEVMDALGGLETFAAKGWVASDMVHFKFSGGKALAGEMTGFWEELIARKIRESRKNDVLEPMEADSSMFGVAVPDTVPPSIAALPVSSDKNVFRRGQQIAGR